MANGPTIRITPVVDEAALSKALARVSSAVRSIQNQKLNLSVNSGSFTQPLGRITASSSEFTKSLEAANARVVAFGASAGLIFQVERAFAQLVISTIQVEKSLTDINVILGQSAEGLSKFGDSLFDIARNTGQSFAEVAKAATELSRQGLSAEETLKRTSDALILSRLSGLDATSSVEALTAALNTFNSVGLTSEQIVNKMANVDASFAVSSSDLAEALKRVGSTAKDVGVSLDQLLGIVAATQQTTARGGSVIGNSLKSIFTRLQRTEVLDQIEGLGVAVRDLSGETLPAMTVLQNLAGAFTNLSKSQQSSIAETVGGVYQMNQLRAILGDLSKGYSIYDNAVKVSASSTNQATTRNKELNKTLDAQLKATVANATQASKKVGDLVFAPAIGNVLGTVNSVLKDFNEKDSESAGGKIATGIMSGIGKFLAGPGLALGLGLLGKLMGNLAKFVGESGAQFLGLNTRALQQKTLQQDIQNILQKNPDLILQASNGVIGQIALQQKLLEMLKAESTIRSQIPKIAAISASQMIQRGARVSSTGQVSSSGFVPNFSIEQQERSGAIAGGYKPGKVVPSPVGGVMNTAETVKHVPGFAQPFINPPRESKAGRAHEARAIRDTGVNPYTAANGFVPNFASTKHDPKGHKDVLPDYQLWLEKKDGTHTRFADGKQQELYNMVSPEKAKGLKSQGYTGWEVKDKYASPIQKGKFNKGFIPNFGLPNLKPGARESLERLAKEPTAEGKTAASVLQKYKNKGAEDVTKLGSLLSRNKQTLAETMGFGMGLDLNLDALAKPDLSYQGLKALIQKDSNLAKGISGILAAANPGERKAYAHARQFLHPLGLAHYDESKRRKKDGPLQLPAPQSSAGFVPNFKEDPDSILLDADPFKNSIHSPEGRVYAKTKQQLKAINGYKEKIAAAKAAKNSQDRWSLIAEALSKKEELGFKSQADFGRRLDVGRVLSYSATLTEGDKNAQTARDMLKGRFEDFVKQTKELTASGLLKTSVGIQKGIQFESDLANSFGLSAQGNKRPMDFSGDRSLTNKKLFEKSGKTKSDISMFDKTIVGDSINVKGHHPSHFINKAIRQMTRIENIDLGLNQKLEKEVKRRKGTNLRRNPVVLDNPKNYTEILNGKEKNKTLSVEENVSRILSWTKQEVPNDVLDPKYNEEILKFDYEQDGIDLGGVKKSAGGFFPNFAPTPVLNKVFELKSKANSKDAIRNIQKNPARGRSGEVQGWEVSHELGRLFEEQLKVGGLAQAGFTNINHLSRKDAPAPFGNNFPADFYARNGKGPWFLDAKNTEENETKKSRLGAKATTMQNAWRNIEGTPSHVNFLEKDLSEKISKGQEAMNFGVVASSVPGTTARGYAVPRKNDAVKIESFETVGGGSTYRNFSRGFIPNFAGYSSASVAISKAFQEQRLKSGEQTDAFQNKYHLAVGSNTVHPAFKEAFKKNGIPFSQSKRGFDLTDLKGSYAKLSQAAADAKTFAPTDPEERRSIAGEKNTSDESFAKVWSDYIDSYLNTKKITEISSLVTSQGPKSDFSSVRSAGFIPNFAPLDDAMSRERSAAGSAVPLFSKMLNSPVVVNKDQIAQYGSNADRIIQGDHIENGQVATRSNLMMSGSGKEKYSSKGFVPNFGEAPGMIGEGERAKAYKRGEDVFKAPKKTGSRRGEAIADAIDQQTLSQRYKKALAPFPWFNALEQKNVGGGILKQPLAKGKRLSEVLEKAYPSDRGAGREVAERSKSGALGSFQKFFGKLGLPYDSMGMAGNILVPEEHQAKVVEIFQKQARYLYAKMFGNQGGGFPNGAFNIIDYAKGFVPNFGKIKVSKLESSFLGGILGDPKESFLPNQFNPENGFDYRWLGLSQSNTKKFNELYKSLNGGQKKDLSRHMRAGDLNPYTGKRRPEGSADAKGLFEKNFELIQRPNGFPSFSKGFIPNFASGLVPNFKKQTGLKKEKLSFKAGKRRLVNLNKINAEDGAEHGSIETFDENGKKVGYLKYIEDSESFFIEMNKNLRKGPKFSGIGFRQFVELKKLAQEKGKVIKSDEITPQEDKLKLVGNPDSTNWADFLAVQPQLKHRITEGLTTSGSLSIMGRGIPKSFSNIEELREFTNSTPRQDFLSDLKRGRILINELESAPTNGIGDAEVPFAAEGFIPNFAHHPRHGLGHNLQPDELKDLAIFKDRPDILETAEYLGSGTEGIVYGYTLPSGKEKTIKVSKSAKRTPEDVINKNKKLRGFYSDKTIFGAYGDPETSFSVQYADFKHRKKTKGISTREALLQELEDPNSATQKNLIFKAQFRAFKKIKEDKGEGKQGRTGVMADEERAGTEDFKKAQQSGTKSYFERVNALRAAPESEFQAEYDDGNYIVGPKGSVSKKGIRNLNIATAIDPNGIAVTFKNKVGDGEDSRQASLNERAFVGRILNKHGLTPDEHGDKNKIEVNKEGIAAFDPAYSRGFVPNFGKKNQKGGALDSQLTEMFAKGQGRFDRLATFLTQEGDKPEDHPLGFQTGIAKQRYGKGMTPNDFTDFHNYLASRPMSGLRTDITGGYFAGAAPANLSEFSQELKDRFKRIREAGNYPEEYPIFKGAAGGFVPNFANRILKTSSGDVAKYTNKWGDRLKTAARVGEGGEEYIEITEVQRNGFGQRKGGSGVDELYKPLFNEGKKSNTKVFSASFTNQALAKGKAGKTISDDELNFPKLTWAFPQIRPRIDAEKKSKMPTSGTLTARSAPGVDNPVEFFKFKTIEGLTDPTAGLKPHVNSLRKIPSSVLPDLILQDLVTSPTFSGGFIPNFAPDSGLPLNWTKRDGYDENRRRISYEARAYRGAFSAFGVIGDLLKALPGRFLSDGVLGDAGQGVETNSIFDVIKNSVLYASEFAGPNTTKFVTEAKKYSLEVSKGLKRKLSKFVAKAAVMTKGSKGYDGGFVPNFSSDAMKDAMRRETSAAGSAVPLFSKMLNSPVVVNRGQISEYGPNADRIIKADHIGNGQVATRSNLMKSGSGKEKYSSKGFVPNFGEAPDMIGEGAAQGFVPNFAGVDSVDFSIIAGSITTLAFYLKDFATSVKRIAQQDLKAAEQAKKTAAETVADQKRVAKNATDAQKAEEDKLGAAPTRKADPTKGSKDYKRQQIKKNQKEFEEATTTYESKLATFRETAPSKQRIETARVANEEAAQAQATGAQATSQAALAQGRLDAENNKKLFGAKGSRMDGKFGDFIKNKGMGAGLGVQVLAGATEQFVGNTETPEGRRSKAVVGMFGQAAGMAGTGAMIGGAPGAAVGLAAGLAIGAAGAYKAGIKTSEDYARALELATKAQTKAVESLNGYSQAQTNLNDLLSRGIGGAVLDNAIKDLIQKLKSVDDPKLLQELIGAGSDTVKIGEVTAKVTRKLAEAKEKGSIPGLLTEVYENMPKLFKGEKLQDSQKDRLKNIGTLISNNGDANLENSDLESLTKSLQQGGVKNLAEIIGSSEETAQKIQGLNEKEQLFLLKDIQSKEKLEKTAKQAEKGIQELGVAAFKVAVAVRGMSRTSADLVTKSQITFDSSRKVTEAVESSKLNSPDLNALDKMDITSQNQISKLKEEADFEKYKLTKTFQSDSLSEYGGKDLNAPGPIGAEKIAFDAFRGFSKGNPMGEEAQNKLVQSLDGNTVAQEELRAKFDNYNASIQQNDLRLKENIRVQQLQNDLLKLDFKSQERTKLVETGGLGTTDFSKAIEGIFSKDKFGNLASKMETAKNKVSGYETLSRQGFNVEEPLREAKRGAFRQEAEASLNMLMGENGANALLAADSRDNKRAVLKERGAADPELVNQIINALSAKEMTKKEDAAKEGVLAQETKIRNLATSALGLNTESILTLASSNLDLGAINKTLGTQMASLEAAILLKENAQKRVESESALRGLEVEAQKLSVIIQDLNNPKRVYLGPWSGSRAENQQEIVARQTSQSQAEKTKGALVGPALKQLDKLGPDANQTVLDAATQLNRWLSSLDLTKKIESMQQQLYSKNASAEAPKDRAGTPNANATKISNLQRENKFLQQEQGAATAARTAAQSGLTAAVDSAIQGAPADTRVIPPSYMPDFNRQRGDQSNAFSKTVEKEKLTSTLIGAQVTSADKAYEDNITSIKDLTRIMVDTGITGEERSKAEEKLKDLIDAAPQLLVNKSLQDLDNALNLSKGQLQTLSMNGVAINAAVKKAENAFVQAQIGAIESAAALHALSAPGYALKVATERAKTALSAVEISAVESAAMFKAFTQDGRALRTAIAEATTAFNMAGINLAKSTAELDSGVLDVAKQTQARDENTAINTAKKDFATGRTDATGIQNAEGNQNLGRLRRGEIGVMEAFGADSMSKMRAESANTREQLLKDMISIKEGMVDSFKTGFEAFAFEGKKAKDVMKDITRSLMKNLMKTSFNYGINKFYTQMGAGNIGAYATGGKVKGGSGGIDDVPAMLTSGEYVIRKGAVSKYGDKFFDKLNSGGPVKLAGGGLAEILPASMGVAIQKAASEPSVKDPLIMKTDRGSQVDLRSDEAKNDLNINVATQTDKFYGAGSMPSQMASSSSMTDNALSFALSNTFAYNDPEKPTIGKFFVDQGMSNQALEDVENPQNELRNKRYDLLTDYRQYLADEVNRRKTALEDFETEKKQMLKSAVINAAVTIGGQALGSIGGEFGKFIASPAGQASIAAVGNAAITAGMGGSGSEIAMAAGMGAASSLVGSYANRAAVQAGLEGQANSGDPSQMEDAAVKFESMGMQTQAEDIRENIKYSQASRAESRYQSALSDGSPNVSALGSARAASYNANPQFYGSRGEFLEQSRVPVKMTEGAFGNAWGGNANEGASKYLSNQMGWKTKKPSTGSSGPNFIYKAPVTKRARGGPMTGPEGTDRIPAMLTAGEYVVRKDSVEKYGMGFLDKLNRGNFDPGVMGFADGGLVPGEGAFSGGGSGVGLPQPVASPASSDAVSQSLIKLIGVAESIQRVLEDAEAEKDTEGGKGKQTNGEAAAAGQAITNNISVTVNVAKGQGTTSEKSSSKEGGEEGEEEKENPEDSEKFAGLLQDIVLQTIVEQQRPGGLLYEGK